MATLATATIGAVLKINDAEYPIAEGDVVNNLRYTVNGAEEVLTGKVRVISATTTAQNVDPHTSCPPNPYLSQYVKVKGLIIDSSTDKEAILTQINVANITGLDSVTIADETDGAIVVGAGPNYKGLDEVIAAAEPGAVIKLAAGEYTMPLNLTKDISIIGNVPGVVLSGKIRAAAPAAATTTSADAKAAEVTPIKIEIANVTLTGDATISVGKGVGEVNIHGCAFGAHNLTAKTMPIQIGTGIDTAEPVLLTIDGNTFVAENEYSYNLIDVYALLKDGSSISGNEFMSSCCTHNQISLYGIESGATININDNHAASSKNLVRIGFAGKPIGTVMMNGNSYDETDSDPKWAGLFLVQPYGTKTESFGQVEITVANNKGPEGYQIGYIYAGKSDTQWTETNKPVIYIDGVKTEIPDAQA